MVGESPHSLAGRRLSRVVRDHVPKLLDFIAGAHGPDALLEAWEEFTLWNDVPFDPDSRQLPLFYPWCFHVWKPLTGETKVKTRCLHGISPSQAYLIAAQQIDPLLYRYLTACLDTPFGFFELCSAPPSHGMQLHEILTETAYSVDERAASTSGRPGDILYGMLVECDGIVLWEASAPLAIPAGLKPRIVQARERLLADQARERAEFAAELAEERAAYGYEPDEEIAGGTATVLDAESLHRHTLLRNDYSMRALYWELIVGLSKPPR